ncbi:PE family protein [Mycobacterium sp.]|uniref:PE family protein n=1 Tax=Mycobacterium sp. TaxID=1785 RepID=UPI0025E6D839|nr:PE family protein [Mycobacterium sp.]
MELDVNPTALGAASAQVAALTGRLLASNATHLVATSATLPPGADLVSEKTSLSLIAEGLEHHLMTGMGSAQLGLSSEGVGESGTSYAIGDAEGAAAYVANGGGALL